MKTPVRSRVEMIQYGMDTCPKNNVNVIRHLNWDENTYSPNTSRATTINPLDQMKKIKTKNDDLKRSVSIPFCLLTSISFSFLNARKLLLYWKSFSLFNVISYRIHPIFLFQFHCPTPDSILGRFAVETIAIIFFS